MTKQRILDEFKDIDVMYNDSSRLETLSRMIDELLDEFRHKFGFAESCENCNMDSRQCQFNVDFSRMDFCGWVDDAIDFIKRSD